MDVKWTIAIPTLPARRSQLSVLLETLEPQVAEFPDVELLILEDNRKREYGPKLQAMIDIAQGEYISFVDDDDRVAGAYVRRIHPLLDGVDCVGFTGLVSIQGQPSKKVRYSIEHKEWADLSDVYLRNPQHLTPIRTELVRKVKWEGHYGADRVWSHKMADAGLLQTENFCEGEPVYFYDVQTDNRVGVWQ